MAWPVASVVTRWASLASSLGLVYLYLIFFETGKPTESDRVRNVRREIIDPEDKVCPRLCPKSTSRSSAFASIKPQLSFTDNFETAGLEDVAGDLLQLPDEVLTYY